MAYVRIQALDRLAGKLLQSCSLDLERRSTCEEEAACARLASLDAKSVPMVACTDLRGYRSCLRRPSWLMYVSSGCCQS